MTYPDDARREERLKRALFEPGGAPRGAGEADMERELSELREVEQRLAAAGKAERERLLREGQDAELEAEARRSFERIAAGASAGPGHRATRWPWLALAAVALLALGWVVWGPRSEPSREGVPLGSGDVELVRPVGEGAAYDAFVWRGQLPASGFYELRIWSAAADPLAPPLVKETCEQPHWTPPDPSVLPDLLRWEVVARGAGGEVLGRAERSASRSSR